MRLIPALAQTWKLTFLLLVSLGFLGSPGQAQVDTATSLPHDAELAAFLTHDQALGVVVTAEGARLHRPERPLDRCDLAVPPPTLRYLRSQASPPRRFCAGPRERVEAPSQGGVGVVELRI